MNIAVVGTNTWNKGMDLIQVAICEHMQAHEKVRLAVPAGFGTFEERAQYGLRYFVPALRRRRAWLGFRLLPDNFKRSIGIVTEDDADAVIDASGFAFGDQHPVDRTVRFARDVERWRGQGKPVILLPQALGPFEQPTIREAFARVLKAASLVYAREPISLEHAQKAYPEATNLRMAPDFTNLVQPLRPHECGSINRACIVPNQRMIEKAKSREEIDGYLPFLVDAVRTVEELGVEPVLLLHGSQDGFLIEAAEERLGHAIPVIEERDPVRIKAELGRSRLVISSRFHALASALSQGVPAIGTSWSHKYEMLFKDYGCEDMVLPIPAERHAIALRVAATIGSERERLVDQIKSAGERLVQDVREMWEEVDRELGLRAAVPSRQFEALHFSN